MSRMKSATTKRRGRGNEGQPKIPCDVCTRENKTVESKNYCMDCDDNLCADCIQQHQKFPAMGSHVMSKVKDKSVSAPEVAKYNPLECTCLTGREIDMYCADHDELLCGSCIATKHRTCSKTIIIKEAAVDVFKNLDIKLMSNEIKQISKSLEGFRKINVKNKGGLEKIKADITTQIQEFRKKLVQLVDDLETATLQELNNAHDRAMKQNADDEKTCCNLLHSFETLLTMMMSAKVAENPETSAFVGVKRVQEKVKESQHLLDDNKHIHTSKPLSFTTDSRIVEWLGSFNLLGTFSYQQQTYSSKLFGKFNVKHSSDSKQCDIYGSAFVEDGRVLLADWDNKCVKMLDSSYALVQVCPVPGSPCDICCINPREAAVSLTNEKSVQFLSFNEHLELKRSIKTGETCRGLAYHDQKLYVICGGFKNECEAKIQVFSIMGDLLRIIERNNADQKIFISPIAIAVTSGGDVFHVTDGQRGIVTMKTNNDVISVIANADTAWPCGICIDRNDNILVCNGLSNKVIQMSGTINLGTILSSADGIQRPHALCFDGKNLRLIVTLSRTNNIMVYQLEGVNIEVTAEVATEEATPEKQKQVKTKGKAAKKQVSIIENEKTPRKKSGNNKMRMTKATASKEKQKPTTKENEPVVNAKDPDTNGQAKSGKTAETDNTNHAKDISKALLSNGVQISPQDLKAAVSKTISTDGKSKTTLSSKLNVN